VIDLVTFHGIGPRGPEGERYADGFRERLMARLGRPIILWPVYWADLIDYRGLGTPLASAVDTALDPIRYTFRWWARSRIKARVRNIADHIMPDRTLVVSHSWGTVLACNFWPDDHARLWVQFGSRRYWPVWFGRPPRVEKWLNVWSPIDPLSEPWKTPVNRQIEERHGPMWTSDSRADIVAQAWRDMDG